MQRTRPVILGAGREVMKPFELGGYLIPPGNLIAISAGLLHTNPRLYPNPDAFHPDRFVGVKPNAYTWVPFGGGVRRCIGAAFAHMEMDIVLRTLLRQLELAPTDARDEAWGFRGVAFAPSRGGLAVVHPRRTWTMAPPRRQGAARWSSSRSRPRSPTTSSPSR